MWKLSICDWLLNLQILITILFDMDDECTNMMTNNYGELIKLTEIDGSLDILFAD